MRSQRADRLAKNNRTTDQLIMSKYFLDFFLYLENYWLKRWRDQEMIDGLSGCQIDLMIWSIDQYYDISSSIVLPALISKCQSFFFIHRFTHLHFSINLLMTISITFNLFADSPEIQYIRWRSLPQSFERSNHVGQGHLTLLVYTKITRLLMINWIVSFDRKYWNWNE